MGRRTYFEIMELDDPHNEFGSLDFDAHIAAEHPEWQTDAELSDEELARIDSDAEIFDYRLNGYE